MDLSWSVGVTVWAEARAGGRIAVAMRKRLARWVRMIIPSPSGCRECASRIGYTSRRDVECVVWLRC